MLESLTAVLSIIDMAGLFVTAVASVAIGLGMPFLLLVGIIDGPTGGRLTEARERPMSRAEAPDVPTRSRTAA